MVASRRARDRRLPADERAHRLRHDLLAGRCARKAETGARGTAGLQEHCRPRRHARAAGTEDRLLRNFPAYDAALSRRHCSSESCPGGISTRAGCLRAQRCGSRNSTAARGPFARQQSCRSSGSSSAGRVRLARFAKRGRDDITLHSAPSAASSSEPHAQHLRLGYLVWIAAVAALGGFLFGYDWVVIGGAKPFYEAYFHLTTDTLIGWANSCALVGCLAGSLLSGMISDRLGRKRSLLLAGSLFAVSSVLTGWAFSFSSFIAMAYCWRPRHRPRFQHFADVYCGNQPGAVARPPRQP